MSAPSKLVSVLAILEVSGEAFCRISSILGQMIILLAHGQIPDTKGMGGNLGELEREAERLELRSVSLHLARVKEHFLGGSATTATMHPMVTELYNRMRDALEERLLITVDPAQANLYRQNEPLFGGEVATKFASANYDIQEAGKCLAFDRSTASVFHSIRCLEASILALSRCLGLPDPIKAADRNWGAMLKILKAEIDRRWPTSTDRQHGDGQTFDELYGSLSGMQNPYRNATMHLDKVYTEEDARHIFEVVRGIMRRVASRCDEDGEPKA